VRTVQKEIPEQLVLQVPLERKEFKVFKGKLEKKETRVIPVRPERPGQLELLVQLEHRESKERQVQLEKKATLVRPEPLAQLEHKVYKV
jgi:hypothetical protein